MDGGNHIRIHVYISVSLVCMDGWDMCLLSYHIYAFANAFRSLYHILLYAYVKGELHLKSSPKLFVITPYVVLSSSKRGRLLVQRPLAPSFDDNKPYVVRY